MTHRAATPFRFIGALRDDARAFLADLGQPPYRADQVLRWIYVAGADRFDAMANLPAALRDRLRRLAVLHTTVVATAQRSNDGTEKLLVRLADGEAVEAVLIPEGPRRTVCVSTQVGCAMGCVFCASGLLGRQRDLTAGEIVEQVLHARAAARPQATLTHVVIMGMGEPLANFAPLVRALHILTAPWGLALSPRRITVSTVGLPQRIHGLATEGPGVNLAISLHAADDATRRRLIPSAHPLRDVVAAARHYQQHTGCDLTFEYVLVSGVNDSPDDARRLADLVCPLPALVNLLPLNPVAGLPWHSPPPARVESFVAQLRHRGANVQVRRRRGADIEAACGQLRRREHRPDKPPTAQP